MSLVKRDNLNHRILRGSYINEHRIEYFKNQNYIQLKKECLRKGVLFEDPLFVPNNRNIFFSKPLPRGTKWMR